jgi:hypothetical protein
MTLRLIVLLGLAALCAVGVATILEVRRAGRLRYDAYRLEPICAECARLRIENAQWQKAISDAGDLNALRSRSAENQHMLASINALVLRQRYLKRELGVRDEAVWPAGVDVIPASEWKFSGQTSPASVMESVLWSSRTGDVDHLAALISFEPNARQKAEALFAGLPAAARNQYGSPEAVIATLIAAQMPTDDSAIAEIARTDPSPDSAILTVRVEDGSGAQRDLDLKFQQEEDVWRLDVPEAVVSRYAHHLLTSPTKP